MCAIAANYRAAGAGLAKSRDRIRSGQRSVETAGNSLPEFALADINAKWRHHLKRINSPQGYGAARASSAWIVIRPRGLVGHQ